MGKPVRQPARSLRRLHRRLLWVLVIYFFAGTASQKLIPGVDEIFPFYGWSLFSKVPGEETTYTLTIHQQNGRDLTPPVSFLKAPDSIVAGNRFIGRKVVQKLGQARDRGETAEEERLRKLLEENYLHGRVRYEIAFERYEPLARWKGEESLEVRSLGSFEAGPPPPAAAPPAPAEEAPRRGGRWRKNRRRAPETPAPPAPPAGEGS